MQDEQGRIATMMHGQASPESKNEQPGRDQVGWWRLSYYDGEGSTLVQEVHGRLVMQEHDILIMDPETRGILWAIPNVNAGPVESCAAYRARRR